MKIELSIVVMALALLMSGWAMGEDRYLKNKSAMMHIPHGNGDIVLFGFRPQFRGQPRGTYKLIFKTKTKSDLFIRIVFRYK